MIEYIVNIDRAVLMYVQTNLHNPVMDKVMILASKLGNGGLIWIIFGVILLLYQKWLFKADVKKRIEFEPNAHRLVFFALILSSIMGEGIIKNLVKRARPYEFFTEVNLLIAKSSQYSFPSGHTSSAFASAYILSKYVKGGAPLFYTIASIMAFSRIYLFMHYPSDVIAGIILGTLCGVAIEKMHEYRKLKTL